MSTRDNNLLSEFTSDNPLYGTDVPRVCVGQDTPTPLSELISVLFPSPHSHPVSENVGMQTQKQFCLIMNKALILEQEKHALRRKLDSVVGDYDSRILELQSDIEELRKELEEQNNLQRTTEKEKAQLLQELTEQNHRLTAQLKQTARTEEQLQAQLQTLREQFNVRRSNLHDHVSQLEGLREEINVLEGRKADLGQRIHALTDERENLNLSLEESGDRIILLQRQNREQEQKIRSQQQDLEDLRQTNSQLQAKLDIILRRSPNGNSLY
ncbi:bicaudal D-related [Caerostris extrusa]|uniref:Bicaudal D-related n=1 Tax=Caerostris extrusa TaxID=172846 RepID=A0AAV4S9V6_CAEEX|nr:bicaudal D-related [Caerostris extrusa]